MIEVVIDSIRVNLTNQQRIVILRQAEDVMNTAAIVPEEDIQQEREAPSAAVAEEEPEEHEGHLDVFESFLNNLNFDLPGDQPGGEGPDVPGDDPGETP